jgi:hypothetical protein
MPARRRSSRLDERLPLAELHSARLDGELVGIGGGFQSVDEPDGPRDRAHSIHRDLADPRVIVCDRSAAWVWGWAPSPVAVATCVSIGARVASPVRRRLRAREAVLDDDETVQLAEVRVTTPLRTVIDLARHDDRDEVVEIVIAALRSGSVSVPDLRAALRRRPGIAHLRRAHDRVERAISRC